MYVMSFYISISGEGNRSGKHGRHADCIGTSHANRFDGYWTHSCFVPVSVEKYQSDGCLSDLYKRMDKRLSACRLTGIPKSFSISVGILSHICLSVHSSMIKLWLCVHISILVGRFIEFCRIAKQFRSID